MIIKTTLIDLFQHMEWADATVWGAILKTPNVQTDTKVQQYLYHLHMAQRAFLRAWKDESIQAPFPTFDNAPALMEWGHSYYHEAFAYLETMSDEQIQQPFPIPWAAMVEQRLGRKPETTTIGETALQVALHSTYHRGQVNTRLREAGGEPPLEDYIAWVWLGRPSPQWP